MKFKIQDKIQEEIQKVKKVTIECDGWTHPNGIHYMGIVLRYPSNDSINEVAVELLETPDFTLDSNEMSKLIKSTMSKLQIERSKRLSLSIDGANDMSNWLPF